VLFPGCGNYFPIPFATPGGNIGIGVGGRFTIGTTSKGNALVFSVWGAPWTIGLASIKNVAPETLQWPWPRDEKLLVGLT
jgi:hypothetical protein